MSYDKKLSKQQRNQITKMRRTVKQTGFKESEKFLNALKQNHVIDVKQGSFQRA